MFDTMTLTKIVGAFCGALLVFLLGGWAAEGLYHVGGGGHGDGEDMATGFVIEVEDGGEAEEEEVVDFATLMDSADAGAGERVWSKCRACHKLEDGANAVGPYLYGVVGRDIGAADGFGAYSGALSQQAEVWTPENLYNFLEKPAAWAPGTTMSFGGLPKPEDRVNLIAFLDQTDG